MTWLRQLFPLLNEGLYTLIFWVLAVGIIYAFFTWVIPVLTRKTKTEIDDVVIEVLRYPLMIILAAYGGLDSLSIWGKFDASIEMLRKIYFFVVIWAMTFLVYKLIRDVFSVYLQDFVEDSDSNLDDVLLPLITRAGPIAVILVASLITIGVYSPSILAEVLTVIGALSFLLIFLFQEPLSNLFSGIYLWIDTPFKYNDLILLEDGTFYRIEDIGSRVSKLYNTEDHTVAFYPNNKLAEQRLINITKPNVELRQGINISIAYTYEYDKIVEIQELLMDIAQRHVHVLGPWDQPGEGIRSKKELIEEEIRAARREETPNTEEIRRLEHEYQRLKLEYQMRDENQQIWEKMITLSAMVSDLEAGGLERKEREFIRSRLDDLKTDILSMRRNLSVWVRWSGLLQAMYKFRGDDSLDIEYSDIERSVVTVEEWMDILKKTQSPEQRLDSVLEKGRIPLIGECNHRQEILLSGIESCRQAHLACKKLKNNSIDEIQKIDPGLGDHNETAQRNFLCTPDLFHDYDWLLKSWSSVTRKLMQHLNCIERMLEKQGACEFQVDSELNNMARHFKEKFMLKVPGFRYPDADFQGYGEAGVDFRLSFFVDDLVGEHFERVGDVISDIGIQIKKHFDVNKIEYPFPKRELLIRGLPENITLKDIKRNTNI